jgi:hypothetical protein
MKKSKKQVPVAPELKTEGSLSEKDQQSQAIERARKFGQEALAQWRRLKEKVAGKFHP